MAQIQESGGGGGGKHGKKGRKKGGTPSVDMTPMVDLAFLLLTFFVLTSNLTKAKTLEMTVPKKAQDKETSSKVQDELANTILLDGNKKGIIYYYMGMLSDTTTLYELYLDPANPKSLRKTIANRNAKIQDEMKYIREVYKSGKFTQDAYGKIKGWVAAKTQPTALDNEVQQKRKQEDYSSTIAAMDEDLKTGDMTQETLTKISVVICNEDQAPFFIVKWCGDATYGEVISVVDELKIGDATKYALTPFNATELRALSAKTGIQYPELKDIPAEEATQQP